MLKSSIEAALSLRHTIPSGSGDTFCLLAATQELDNKTLDSAVAKGTWTASGTWTLPALTLGGKLTGGASEIEGSNFDIDGGAIDGVTITSPTLQGTVAAGTGLTMPAFSCSGKISISEVGIDFGYDASTANYLSSTNNNVTLQSYGSLTLQTAAGTGQNIILNPDSNVVIGVLACGTGAVRVAGLGSGTAPSTAPANMSQIWSADINGAAGYAGPHFMVETNALPLIMVGANIKTTTGQVANPFEGLVEINTFDNTVKMYADGAWRQLATW